MATGGAGRGAVLCLQRHVAGRLVPRCPSPSLQQPRAALTWPLLLSLDWQDALAQLAI